MKTKESVRLEKASFKQQFAAYYKNEHSASFFRLCCILAVILVIITAVRGEMFWTLNNIKSIMLQFPEFGLLGLAFMLAFAAGSTDLSVVGIANLTSVITAKYMVALITPDTPAATQVLIIIGACVIALVIGQLCGRFNGFLINTIGIPSIIATLGAGQLFLGAALSITRGASISNISAVYSAIGNYSVLGIFPVPVLVYAVFAVLVSCSLRATTFGQKLFMTGSNVAAAKFSGIDTKKINISAHTWSGVLSAFSGIVMSSRTNSANANFGSSYVMLAILVAVLGGADSDGGYGSVAGITLALIVLQCLVSTLNMFYGVSQFYRDLIWGATLIIVVVANSVSKSRRQKS